MHAIVQTLTIHIIKNYVKNYYQQVKKVSLPFCQIFSYILCVALNYIRKAQLENETTFQNYSYFLPLKTILTDRKPTDRL